MIGNSIPLTDPAILPIPMTELMEFLGKLSDTVVNRLALHAWCAAAANPIKPTACQIFVAYRAVIIGTTQKAKISMAILRALNMGQPFFMNQDER